MTAVHASVGDAMKQLTIATGLFRPARWLSRKVRPAARREFRDYVHLYRRLLPPGALCFDVGANVGKRSEALLHAGARVVAFEPNPRVLRELRARCGHWKSWTLMEAALGSTGQFGTLYARQRHGASGLLKEWADGIIETYHVPVLTLDAAIRHFGRPFYCKIDVEGWELEVLKGLSVPIPLLSFEFHLVERDISKAAGCLELLQGLGQAQVNLSPAEDAVFHFAEWQSLDTFRQWFPGDLERSLPHDIYGDIFVKSGAAR